MPLNSVTNYFTVNGSKSKQSTTSNSSGAPKLRKPSSDWWSPKVEMSKVAKKQPSFQRKELKRQAEPYTSYKPLQKRPFRPAATSTLRSSFDAQKALAKASEPPVGTLSAEQEKILQRVTNGESLFYTGAAGTGKSFLLRRIIHTLASRYAGTNAVAVTATTGLAASNIGGQTIHSWASCRIATESVDAIVTKLGGTKQWMRELRNRWTSCRVLIIDEVSMLPCDLLSKIDAVARKIRKSQAPFGGIQVVFTGDFFQLPPITPGNSRPPLCFDAPEWAAAIGDREYILKTVFRQKGDGRLIAMLNEMRTGSLSDTSVQLFTELEREVQYEDGLGPTRLYPKRFQVEEANNRHLQLLPGPARTYKAIDHYANDAVKAKLRELMAPESLKLRAGAQVLCIRNMSERQLVNGSRGRVLTFMSDLAFGELENAWKTGRLARDTVFRGVFMYIETVIQQRIKNEFSDDLDSADFNLSPHEKEVAKDVAFAINLEEELLPVVDFGSGNIQLINFETFELLNPSSRSQEPDGSRCQLPLILSYALSIHKSQGQTIDRLQVDLDGTFATGQAYVAVSRATSFDRLQVLGFSKSRIQVDQRVIEYYQRLKDIAPQ